MAGTETRVADTANKTASADVEKTVSKRIVAGAKKHLSKARRFLLERILGFMK
jgi:hypothetical protein